MKRAHLLISCALLVHAIAWFVPVVKDGVVLPDGLPGWQAFRIAASPVWPYEGTQYDTRYLAVLSTASAVTTVLFIVGSPLVLWRGSRSWRQVSGWAATAAFVLNLHWFILFGADRWDLRIGYFMWWLSFGLLAIGLFDLARESRIEKSATKQAASAV
jgi:Na+-transporting NADH:ubiquinone oxidoreductase subunit NqrB